MADFSIEFEKGMGFEKYLKEFKQRMVINPYFSVKLFVEGNFAFFHIKPLVFPIYYVTPFIWLIGYILRGGFSIPLFVIGCIPGITILLYMKQWYLLALYIGKWKGKYKGKIKVL